MKTVRFTLPLLLALATTPVRAQIELRAGPPADAFADGPIRLGPVTTALLANAYPHNTVPITPLPFRVRLDRALVAGNTAELEAARKDLAATHGVDSVLTWERTRFLGTGGIAIAALHARSLATVPNAAETVAMLWLYAFAASMTDAARCVDPAARDRAIDRLRGPVNEPVLKVIRTMPDDALARAQETALRLEPPLAEQRSDDSICRNGIGRAETRPIEQWRPAAGNTRMMLPRHLKAILSVLRPRPG